MNSLDATVYTDNASLSYRLDGNNVDIDTESANLAENQIRYYTLLDSMTQEFSRIKTVLAAR
ncbi:MAG: flagellar basal body rod protein FlgB [Mobilitalea sp.]